MLKFGDWLAGQRKLKNISQEELGAKVGMHSRNISRIERNAGMPNPGNLRRLVAFFGVSDVDGFVAAVKAESGELPEVESEPLAEMKIPVYLAERIRQMAGSVDVEPTVWLSDVLDWVVENSSRARELSPWGRDERSTQEIRQAINRHGPKETSADVHLHPGASEDHPEPGRNAAAG